MWNEADVMQLIAQFIPPDAKLLRLEDPNKHLAVISADLDGDSNHEIAAAYRWRDNNSIIILRWYNGYWQPMAFLHGKGYGITFINAAPITGKKYMDLIIGWQLGAIYSQLDIFEWNGRGFRSLIKDEMIFSEIEVANIPTKKGFDKRYELALWTHDTGDAYQVEIYHWRDGRLKPFPEAYPYYFGKVVDYYQKQVIKHPKAAFYWYYLADAQTKAEHYGRALKSIDTALELNSTYPPLQVLLELKEYIISKLRKDSFLYPAKIKDLSGISWGYINSNGVFAIKPRYDYAMDFQDNDLAVVGSSNMSGVIDRFGRYIAPPKYYSISPYSEGRAVIIDASGSHVIDEEGRLVTDKAYQFIGIYNNGKAVYSDAAPQGQPLYGYLDRQGKEAIPMQYQHADDFYNNQAVVKIAENKFALIDKKGNILYTYNYASVGSLGEGLLSFQQSLGDKYGYISIYGDEVLAPQYSSAQAFKDGRAIVNTSDDYTNKYGLIDKKGNFLISPVYNDIYLLGENRAAIGSIIDSKESFSGSVYAIADTINGDILTDFIYKNLTYYNMRYVSASDGKNTFFLNLEGHLAEELPVIKGSGTLAFVGKLIKADIDNRISYINQDKKVIWQQNTVITINNQYKLVEKKYKPNENYIVYYPQLVGIKDEETQLSINKTLRELSQVNTVEQAPTDYSYNGDFSVKFYRKYLLVLELEGYEYHFGAAHGMPTMLHANLDLVSGKFYKLEDLFKADSSYVKIISDIIAEQIKTDPEYSYILPAEYKGISDVQPFYVKEDSLYVYFAPYEIAAFAAGFPTFRIPFSEIMSIIDKEGSFWKAFN